MNNNIEFDELFALRISFQDEFENENDIMCELKYELLKRGTPIEYIPNILKQFYEYIGINMTIEQIIEILYTTHEEQISNQFINILNNYITNNIQVLNNQEHNNQEIQEIQEANIQEANIQEANIQENYEQENYEDTSSNIINFLNNPTNGNIQFTFYSSNSTNSISSIRTIQYTFNRNSIFQSNLRNIINSNSLFSTQGIFNSLLFEPIMEDVVSTLDDSEKDKLKVYKLIEKKEEKCAICMSEINVDEQVCDLPCAHTFHDECIQPWLNHYNYKCPVCRKEVGKPKHNI